MTRTVLATLLALGLGGCKTSSQVVLGLLTDIAVPTPLTAATLEVYRDGVQLADEPFSPLATAPGELYRLPGSFDFYSPSGGTPVAQFVLTGFAADGRTIVTREATLQFASEAALFYRMALVVACEGVMCTTGKTCIEGTCQSEDVMASKLPRYDKARADTIECDSHTPFIDTSTCGTGCQPLPVSGTCKDGQVCVEGTCYDPA